MVEPTLWVGGEHVFAFNLGELEALQNATGSGPGEVFGRLYASLENPITGPWLVGDVIDTLRIGLIGGGMDASEARAKVKAAFDRHGVSELIGIAAEVLLTALQPHEGQDAGKPRGEAPPKNGTSGKSTKPDQP